MKLENNYASRQMRLDEWVDVLDKKLIFDEFNENERKILAYLYGNERITVKIAAELIEMITETTRNFLKMLEKGAVGWHGNSKNDPKQYYSLR